MSVEMRGRERERLKHTDTDTDTDTRTNGHLLLLFGHRTWMRGFVVEKEVWMKQAGLKMPSTPDVAGWRSACVMFACQARR